jgi:hypothetical protein
MYSVSGGVVSLVGMVIWHWYALKMEVNVYRKLNIKTITDHVSKAYFAKSIVKRTSADYVCTALRPRPLWREAAV